MEESVSGYGGGVQRQRLFGRETESDEVGLCNADAVASESHGSRRDLGCLTASSAREQQGIELNIAMTRRQLLDSYPPKGGHVPST